MGSKTALLIIDVQLGMYDESDPVFRGDELLSTVGDLVGRARAARVPVVYVQHDGSAGDPLEPGLPGWPIHPAIGPRETELVVRKQVPNAFQGTDLEERLQERGIGHLVIAGMQTDCCVDATCRGAHSLGYEVTLVQDGHSTWDDGGLTAQQIIDQHNETLGDGVVTLRLAREVKFGRPE
jgi:nicotinamidase-related amidase